MGWFNFFLELFIWYGIDQSYNETWVWQGEKIVENFGESKSLQTHSQFEIPNDMEDMRYMAYAIEH